MAGHNYPREELVLADRGATITTSRRRLELYDRTAARLNLAKPRQAGIESKEYSCSSLIFLPFLSSHPSPSVHLQASLCGTRYTWTWYRGAKRFWQFLVERFQRQCSDISTKLCLACVIPGFWYRFAGRGSSAKSKSSRLYSRNIHAKFKFGNLVDRSNPHGSHGTDERIFLQFTGNFKNINIFFVQNLLES